VSTWKNGWGAGRVLSALVSSYTADTALDLVHKKRPDLIVLDIMLHQAIDPSSSPAR